MDRMESGAESSGMAGESREEWERKLEEWLVTRIKGS